MYLSIAENCQLKNRRTNDKGGLTTGKVYPVGIYATLPKLGCLSARGRVYAPSVKKSVCATGDSWGQGRGLFHEWEQKPESSKMLGRLEISVKRSR